MNAYLLQLVGKWVSLLIVSMTSFFGSFVLTDTQTISNNKNINKSLSIEKQIVEYEVLKKYNSKVPVNITNVITKGEDGIVEVSSDTDKNFVLKEVVNEVLEIGTGPQGKFTGRMTGYGPDCVGCSPVGNVGCRIPNKSSHSLKTDGITYNDADYGEVKIIAASQELFPCGTIIEVTNSNFEKFTAIVIDSGGTMRKAWRERQEVWIDLAFSTQKDPEIRKATARNVNYSVQRWGW